MYIWKFDNFSIKNVTKASKEIGVTRQYLWQICSKKVKTKKTIAYCITKYLDSEAEIEDYFIKV